MARVSTNNRQTGCRNVTCHILSVRIQHVSKCFGKGDSGGLSDKKGLPPDVASGASFHLNSD